MFTVKTSRPLALALAATALAPNALPALAAEGESIAVQYSDLNLASAEGQRVLDRRLERAARNVCGMDEIRVGTRLASREATACYRETRARLDRHFAQLTTAQRQGV